VRDILYVVGSRGREHGGGLIPVPILACWEEKILLEPARVGP
jgi:hypothetical protein